jgi:uroporphyrinogen decarboxylase
LAAWHSQGLPDAIDHEKAARFAYGLVGGRYPWPENGLDFPVNERMIPQFEEKVIEEKEDSLIVRDWKGNICEISKKYSVAYLRDAIDFVTRRWIRCPVEQRDDWEEMRQRYNAKDPARFPKDPEKLSRQLRERSWVVELHFSGPFWQMREWLGFEKLCMLFYDDPSLVFDMVSFWQDFVAQLMRNAFRFVTPDSVYISEDMAFKNHPMISPAMVRTFLLPCYSAWGELIRAVGCPLYALDSDGYVGDLIPIWIEAGINVCDPMEVAAGNDIVEYRKRFGHAMAYRGGVDKRAMAKGDRALEQEIERLRPVVADGGYIPGCDHGVPADVSWENYLQTIRLLAEATGWL